MSTTDLSIVTFFVWVATLLFAPEVAGLVGPYMAIMLSAALGAAFALVRRDANEGRMRAVLFVLRVIGLATILTAGLADLAHNYFPAVNSRLMLAPIAFLFGLVGDDVPTIARWAGGKISSWVDAWIRFKYGNGPPPPPPPAEGGPTNG